jgi:hypothetical protein
MILAVIMWCLCALVGAVICRPKNREAEGAALGFVLGPIGVIVAILLQPKTPADAPDSAPVFHGARKYNCPRCHRPLPNAPRGRGTCAHCGHFCVGE